MLGGPLEPCGTDPLTGFYRDGCCSTEPEDLGRHTICAVVTAEFLERQHRRELAPGPPRRLRRPVVLASTHQATLDVVPLNALREHAVDVPDDLGNL